MQTLLRISPEVSAALQSGQPVVALESTIISHGMPYPQNVETALAVEETVRIQGAIPATIAIMEGTCRVGLSQPQLEYLGKENKVWKVSLRDMAYVLSQGLYGATTVAATLRIAHSAGIRVFATGGIGGVHRGAAATMDISADLTEMAQTPVAIVSAGVKSILDIGLTLEYLETLGIPAVTVGQHAFPSFYSRQSNYASPLRLDTPEAIAHLLHTHWQLGMHSAVLIANPTPAELQIPAATMEKHIAQALAAAQQQQITGKAITPFLLQYLATHTQGESLEANIALVKSNARLAAEIAVSLGEYNGIAG